MTMKIVDDAGLKAVFKELDRRASEGERPWSKAGLAEEIGIQKQAINNWRKVPAERVPIVARILGLKKSVLRPDLYEAADNGPPTPVRSLRDLPRSRKGKVFLKGSARAR